MKKKETIFLVAIPTIIVIALILRVFQYFDNTEEITVEVPQEIQTETSCVESSDCIAVESNPCCTCENGGVQVAINKEFLGEWSSNLKSEKLECKNTMCAAVYNCIVEKPQCIDNQCTLINTQPQTINVK